MLSTILSSTSLVDSKWSVHRFRPSGGVLQASCTKRASPAPSSFGGRERLLCFLRFSARSSPSSTERRRTRSTVARPTSSSSAISSSVSPSSAFSKIRARCASSRDGRARERISASAVRSSSVRFTMYRFMLFHGARSAPHGKASFRLSQCLPRGPQPLGGRWTLPFGSERAADEVQSASFP
jgi:hypothetical protein